MSLKTLTRTILGSFVVLAGMALVGAVLLRYWISAPPQQEPRKAAPIGLVDSQPLLEDKLELTQATLEVDQEDLEALQQELIRAGGDPRSKIQQMKEQHEALDHEQTGVAATLRAPMNGMSYVHVSSIRSWRSCAANISRQDRWRAGRRRRVSELDWLPVTAPSYFRLILSEFTIDVISESMESSSGPPFTGKSSTFFERYAMVTTSARFCPGT